MTNKIKVCFYVNGKNVDFTEVDIYEPNKQMDFFMDTLGWRSQLKLDDTIKVGLENENKIRSR